MTYMMIHMNGNLAIQFANGWVLSIGIGAGHYCRKLEKEFGDIAKASSMEICIWDKNHKVHTKDIIPDAVHDDIATYVSIERLPQIAIVVQAQP